MKKKVIDKELTTNEVVEQGVPEQVESSSADIAIDPQQENTAKAYEVRYIPLYKDAQEESRVRNMHRFYTIELELDKTSGRKKIKKIELDNRWNDKVPAKVVHCTDGDVTI